MMDPGLILLADAHEDSRIVYAAILRYGGFGVAEATDGIEALRMVRQLRPIALVLEATLPVVDGCEVLRLVKRDELSASTPVLIITADTRPEVRHRAVEAGCAAFILKPCRPRELLQAVRAAVSGRVSGG